ncbi:MAG: diguanylate cyclase [Bradymonadia bacterium]
MNRRFSPGVTVLQRLDAVMFLALSGGLALATVLGAFEPGAPRWLAWGLCWLLALGLGLEARHRSGPSGSSRPHHDLEGPVLWMVTALVVCRIFTSAAPELAAICFGTAGWLFATTAARVRLTVLAVAMAVELGHVVAGRGTLGVFLLHLALYGAACLAFSRLGSFQRWMVERAQAQARAAAEADVRGRAVDFGMHTRQAEVLPRLPSLGEPMTGPTVGRSMLDFVDQSIALSLDGLRRALGLNTAAVLWHNRELAELHLRGLSTTQPDAVQRGPFAPGIGVPATVVRGEVREMQVAPVRAGYSGLPYYGEAVEVGSLLATAIPHRLGVGEGERDEGVDGVLCVDRASADRFTDDEREAVRVCARKIALDVACGRTLKQVEVDRGTMGRFVAVLRELNGVLGVEPVAQAATHAVKSLFKVDLVAVSLLEGDLLRVAQADGLGAERFQGLQFTPDEGLTGQAVRLNLVLPSGGEYKGVQPVFTVSDRLTDLRSLLVLPLVRVAVEASEAPEVIGALTVGAREAGLFPPAQQRVLELVATTLGVKLELARSHERIRELATQDGLTGLATRRVFDERIEAMVQRAERLGGRIGLILSDIDHFKKLNDTYGHPFGDVVLRQVAQVAKRAVRKVDLAARYGGEEFVVLLDDASEEGAVLLAERIRKDVEALRFDHDGTEVKVTLSLGVSAYPQDATTAPALTDAADQALYRAKHGGRNRTVAHGRSED